MRRQADVAHPKKSQAVQPAFGHLADAPDASDRQRVEQTLDAVGFDDEEPVRLVQLAAKLCEGSGSARRRPSRVSRGLPLDAPLDLFGHRARSREARSVSRQIEENASSSDSVSTTGE